MQLVAYGAQDIYLTGNPQITFFKVVYRRHTNFSMEAIQQTWNGNSGASAGSPDTTGRCIATISRNGDLVSRMWFEVDGKYLLDSDTTSAPGQTDNPGSSMIVDVELEIGGQKIDRHTGNWMEAWAQLTEPNPDGVVYAECAVGTAGSAGTTLGYGNKGTLFQRMTGMGGYNVRHADSTDLSAASYAGGGPRYQKFHIPLQFWFCRNPGLALPLIALQYHEVKVVLNHRMGIFARGGIAGVNQLWCDYIYLDTDERRRFAQVSHEYLIEQVQEQSMTEGANAATSLHFNHPVKELIWARTEVLGGQGMGVAAQNAPGVGGGGVSADIGSTYQLLLNGQERFAARDLTYFTRTQIWEHHSGAGGLNSSAGGFDSQLATTNDSDATGVTATTAGQLNDSIAVYSFALKPEEHQPSGTCNFSRIDNAELVTVDGNNHCNLIWAVNYNVLRIMSGMGGLAYSN